MMILRASKHFLPITVLLRKTLFLDYYAFLYANKRLGFQLIFL